MTTAIKNNSLLGNLFGTFFISIEKKLARRSAYNRTLRELNALSERELWDLGLARADIDSVAREASRAI